jgi:competence protein ComEC
VLRRVAPPHLLLAAYCAGICVSLAVRPSAWLLLVITASGAALLASSTRSGPKRGAAVPQRASGLCSLAVIAGLAAFFLVAGLAAGQGRLNALRASRLAVYTGHTVDVSAELSELPAVKGDQVTLAVKVRGVGGARLAEPAHLRLRLNQGERFAGRACAGLVEGALIRVRRVSVQPLPTPRPGAFDYGRYLRRRGEHVMLEAGFADLRLSGHRGGLRGVVDRLRQASRAHLRAGVHAPVSEVLQGMVLGDDQGVDQQIVTSFRRSGLLHIMAVSGENVVLLCGMWSFAFCALGLPRLVRTGMLVPVVVVYVLLTGASPSIVRAGVAGVVGLMGVLVSRPTDGWLLWLAPAAWLLTVNPNNLYDVSFQLSFGAVAGLLVLARPLTRLVAFLPAPLPEQIGITSAASLSTAPVSMLAFGSTSLVAVPANVVAGFVLAPIMFLGMLSLLLGFVSPLLAAPLNVAAGFFIGFLLEVSRRFANLPWAVFEWQGLSLRLLLCGALLAELAGIAWAARRRGCGLLAYLRDRSRRPFLAAVTIAIVAAVLLLSPAAPRPPRQPTITFLSVGEGAATLVQIPRGPTVLIDAGPTPLAGTLRAHGVRRIDLLVLSHGHADHVAGLQNVIGSIPIVTALMPKPNQPSAALDRLEVQMRAAGTAVSRCTAPLVATGSGWGLHVLPTRPPPGESGNQGENDCALVALIDLAGQHMLVPGDAEGSVLEPLHLPSCIVVELPHHGSRGGLDAAELRSLAPRLAVISVGPNTYGHPTAEMLTLLASARVPCARTDQYGDVAVSACADGLRVTAAGRSP